MHTAPLLVHVHAGNAADVRRSRCATPGRLRRGYPLPGGELHPPGPSVGDLL